MKIEQIKIQLNELEMTAQDIADGDLTGPAAAQEIMQRVNFIREHLPQDRGGWKNPASAENGKKGGRPRNIRITQEQENVRDMTNFAAHEHKKIPAVASRKIEYPIENFSTLEDMLNVIGENVYGYDRRRVIVRIPKSAELPAGAAESNGIVNVWYSPKNNSDQRKTFNHHKSL